MRLLGEIFTNTESALSACTLVIGGGGYFEGVKAVGDFSPERVVLFYPRQKVEIEGENLSIAKYYEGDLRLSGKIYKVTMDADKNADKNAEKGVKKSAEA